MYLFKNIFEDLTWVRGKKGSLLSRKKTNQQTVIYSWAKCKATLKSLIKTSFENSERLAIYSSRGYVLFFCL